MSDQKRRNRPSISVSGKIYDMLREAHPQGSLAALVDGLISRGLDDPAIAARVVAACQDPVLS